MLYNVAMQIRVENCWIKSDRSIVIHYPDYALIMIPKPMLLNALLCK